MATNVANPAFELRSGYTRVTLTTTLTRVSVSPIHERHLDALVAATRIIRGRLERRGEITRRLTGSPQIHADGTIRVIFTDRMGRRRHAATVTPVEITGHLEGRRSQ